MEQHIELLTSKIIPVLKPYNIKRAGLFGSVVRNELTNDSDIDLLVEIGDRISLLGFIGLQQELEDKLGRAVDLVEYKTIKPALKKYILGEEVRIYEA